MKKKVTVLSLVLCLILLAACGAPSPTDALKSQLEDTKDSGALVDLSSEDLGEEAGQALVDKMLDFDYEFGEETISDDTATVETTIITYPFGEILSSVFTEMLTKSISSLGAMTDEQMSALADETLIAYLDKAEKTYTTKVTVIMKKNGGKWQVQEQGNDALSDAVAGGLSLG